MLNDHEKRHLRAIERSLEQDDPGLAEQLRTANWQARPVRTSRHLPAVMVSGLVMALFGLLLGPVIILLGLTLAAVGFVAQLVASENTDPDEPDGSDGVPRPR